MLLLKSLVIGMGVLIVLGMALLAWGLYHKTGKQEEPASLSSVAPPIAAPMMTFGDVPVDLGQGCTIKTVIPDGSRLWLHLEGTAAQCQRVLAIDLTNGRTLGSVGPLQP